MKWLLIGMLGLCGCVAIVTEGDRLVNDQTKKAGQFIAATAKVPEVAGAGVDVTENAEILQANVLGKPAADISYSPEASAQARARAQEEHSFIGQVGDFVRTNVHTGLTALGLGGLVTFLGLWFKRGKKIVDYANLALSQSHQLATIVKGVEKVKAELNDQERKNLVEILTSEAVKEGVYQPIHNLVHAIKGQKGS